MWNYKYLWYMFIHATADFVAWLRTLKAVDKRHCCNISGASMKSHCLKWLNSLQTQTTNSHINIVISSNCRQSHISCLPSVPHTFTFIYVLLTGWQNRQSVSGWTWVTGYTSTNTHRCLIEIIQRNVNAFREHYMLLQQTEIARCNLQQVQQLRQYQAVC